MKKPLLISVFARTVILIILSLATTVSFGQTVQTWTTSGSWTCPYGVTSIQVETWGAGGAGGGVSAANAGGGGGGGGAYLKVASYPVSYGTVYNYVVGTGGIGASGAAGPAGGASSFNGTNTAAGGAGGGFGASGAFGSGATGGTYNGGNGSAGVSGVSSGAGGGGAGSTGAGGLAVGTTAGAAGGTDGGAGGAGRTTAGTGNNGNTFGGGGGGAKNTGTATSRPGGNGANGRVRITYTVTCTAPPVQPTSLVLTPGMTTVAGSFTAATYTDGYLVVRTTTSTAPTNPVNGTTYTAGTSALGGYIESAGAGTSWNSTGLSTSTTYWYWVFGYNNTACTGGITYRTASPLTGNTTTLACGSVTNTVTLTASGTYQWSALSWSLGHVPTSCENAEIILNNSGGSNDQATVNFDVDFNVHNFIMTNMSPTATKRHLFSTTGNVNGVINGNLTITAPGGHKYNRAVFANTVSTTIYGDIILGRLSPGATDGHAGVGSTGSNPNQLYTLYGNMYFNPRGYTTDEWTKFVFDKAGTQYIYNNTLATDTVQPCLFENLQVGNVNATTLIFGGTTYDAYMELVGRAGVTINNNSTLVLPANYSFNVIGGGTPGYFIMNAGSRLKLGGDQSIAGSYGVAGSNFPSGYSPYTFSPTSTIEYNGSNSITQTVYNGVTYQNLELTNGSGSGRAAKNTTGALTISASGTINALADLTLGNTVASAGPLTVLSTGGLYCAANVVSGAGAFTLNSGGYLGMGHAQGISSGTTAAGNIQMMGGRSFSTGGNYIYNGSVAQITGNGLPVTCNDLTINNPTTVTIANSQTVTGVHGLLQGIFDIGSGNKITITGNGTLTSSGGKMKANLGLLELNGSSGTAQSLAGSWFVNRNISTLINSNTTGITVAATAGDTLLISSALLYGSGTTNSVINTNNNLTLLSRDTATARFGQIVTGSGNSITGNVNVERYISTLRKWRHLAWPTTSTQTVMQSWMENNATPNGNTKPGYGTIVTDEKATWSTNGFDSRSVSGPSVKYYDPATDAYIGIPNTGSYQMNSQSAYYNYVRGDRSCTPANSLTSSTILRTTGTLKTGNQVFNISAGKYGSVGNPYASAIDLRQLDTLNLTSTFYVWDPKLTGTYGLGAYQTLYVSGGGYKVMPGGGSYGTLNSFVDTLESGQAMFVKARSASAGTLTFKESAKTIGARTMSRINGQEEAVYSLLSLRDPGGNTLVDGCMAAFDQTYNSLVDDDDALKMVNTSENVSYKRNGQLMAIERRGPIQETDTLFLNFTGARIHAYQFDVSMEQMNLPGRTAMFVDKYEGTRTPLSLTGTNAIQFDVINNPQSLAADRFMIVFRQPAGALPVRYSSISAVRNQNKTVTVMWTTQNEISMTDYKVERSLDGTHFTEIGTQAPLANNGNGASYSYLDKYASEGVNYYRVRGNSQNGQVQYTAIVKVGPLGKESQISIYPNPVTDGIANIRFENQPKGNYTIAITNKIGQLIRSDKVSVQNSNTVQMISLGSIATGTYHATVTDEAGTATTISFMVR